MTSARPDASTPRALVWLYAPLTQRPLLGALCAIEAEIGASLKPGVDHQVAHLRLEWWRTECARCAQGQPAHPLTRAVAQGFEGFAGHDLAPLAGLAGLVDAAAWDLGAGPLETRREVTGDCEPRAGTVIVPPPRVLAPVAD